MSVVAHLVGIDQIGYEKELGLTLNVSSLLPQTFFSERFMDLDNINLVKYGGLVLG